MKDVEKKEKERKRQRKRERERERERERQREKNPINPNRCLPGLPFIQSSPFSWWNVEPQFFSEMQLREKRSRTSQRECEREERDREKERGEKPVIGVLPVM